MTKLPLLFLIFILALVFVSCGGDSSGSSKKSRSRPGDYEPASPVILYGDVYAYQWIALDYDGPSLIQNLPSPSGTFTYTLEGHPSWLSVDSSTGALSGISTENKVYEDIIIKATDSGDASEYTRIFSLASVGDPLLKYSWHLDNSAQKAFSLTAGLTGFDANLKDVYNLEQVTGAGIKIAISDTGGEINHDDFHMNIIEGANKDYSHSEWVGTPTPTTAHGTAVAGLVAAKGWNNIGSMGVAPDANIAIFQFLDSPQSTKILIDQASGDFDIFNYSYGDELYYDTQSSSTYVDFLKHKVQNGRGGKGSIFVKAAGNEYLLADDGNPSTCVSHNANAPFENEVPWMIIVGAINADGEKATYSNAGSNLWISAPGGEYGDSEPALITTDLPTCFKGYASSSGGVNSFEYKHALNTKCNYTSSMNGTSGATPIISGIIALMLEANSDLTWRDVKHILASTAVQVDASTDDYPHPSLYFSDCTNLDLSGHTYEEGWSTNNAGVKFHNFFGFGLVDALAAVQMAKSMTGDALDWLPMPTMVELNNGFSNSNYRRSPSVSIPDASSSGISDAINVSSSINVETVQIKVKVTHAKSGQIGIELESPGGTKSIMLNINNSFMLDDDSHLNIVLASNAFYGESANGNWTLKVIDGRSGSTGQLDQWDINFIGHN